MAEPMPNERQIEFTPLRRSFERARTLALEQQIEECVDLLQHPDLVIEEVLDAYRTLRTHFAEEGSGGDPEEAKEEVRSNRAEGAVTVVEDYFWETRELMVLGDKYSFTCLATNVDPLGAFRAPGESRPGAGLSEGLDYVGLTCDRDAVVTLGAVQSPGDATAYPLLLRLLACLTEIAPDAQLARMNRQHFKGIANPAQPFDLNLVLWDRGESAEAIPLCELTRDLAEKIKAGVLASADFPARLGEIVCLRMNPERFDGRMRLHWRV